MIDEVVKKLEHRKIRFENINFLAGDASPRKYYSILQGQENNVLMLDNDLGNIDNYIYFTKKLQDHVSVPKIINNLRDCGILILENFSPNKFSELLSNSNRNDLYKNAIDALIYIHKNDLKIKLNSYDLHTFLTESDLFFDWFLDKYEEKEREEEKLKFNNIFKSFLDKAMQIPNVLIHRDYHIDNLFFLKNRESHFKCGWIDFQDALNGPCVYDLVSITQDARIDVEKELENYLINYYLDQFKLIDKLDFLYSYKVIAIQRHLKVLGIFSRLYKRDKKDNYQNHIPRVLRLLRDNLEFPDFLNLKKILTPILEKEND